MTLSVQVPPEVEARLRALAERSGKDVTEYVAELIEKATAEGGNAGKVTAAEFDRALDELFSGDGRKLPALGADSRADIYSDHD